MTHDIDLLAIRRGTVSAPAGCGKTHLIAEALKRHADEKPALILTHTNAGVVALRQRLDKMGVPVKAYRLATLDGWAMRLIATFPARANCDPKILSLTDPKNQYPAIRKAAAEMLKAKHLGDVLAATYSRLIVDEYQDCSLVQHAIVYYAAQSLPCCVLGDPMQAVFTFQGQMAHWDDHVCRHFPLAGELTTPWRWKNVDEEDFGKWLLSVREDLKAGRGIDLSKVPSNVTWVRLNGKDDHQLRLSAGQTKPTSKHGGVLIIGESTKPLSQQQFASQTPGAITVESVDLKDLVLFAKGLNLNQSDALNQVVNFAQSVMTNVGGADLLRRVDILRRGTNRSPPSETESEALAFAKEPSHLGAINLLAVMGRESGVRTHRPTVLQAAMKALRTCHSTPDTTFYDAAVAAREQNRILGRPLPQRAVGSTLLLKGLEAEVAVILDPTTMDACHLYVAMTRGSKKLVICSREQIIKPKKF